MKYLLILVLVCNVFFMFSEPVYAQGMSISQKIEQMYNDVLSNPKVSKCIDSVKAGWASFKKWFNNLPGIRHYNNSIYSDKNWKKTMNSMGNEYAPHLQKNSAGVHQLREGKKQWDNL